MKLYHGTNKDFDRIDLSADYEQALNMAKVKTEQLESGSPIVQTYFIDDVA